MKDIEFQTKALINSIRKSNEYNQYQRLYAKIEQDVVLLSGLNEFRKRNLNIQLQGNENSLETCAMVRMEYEKVLSNPLVSEFLIAEQRLTTMLKEITHLIYDNVDLKIDFMED
ncbi:MAG TPA: YlbF family regulator [Lachnospiraceae bacterium]|nr:YlbF family regulator [Lachnospiraceae bacterium]